HVPVAFMRDNLVRGGTYSKFKVEPGKKYFVNVGAVGQPRDNNPKAAYVVYDVHEGTIELRRLEYDIAAAQKKILAAGLPERLANGQLLVGLDEPREGARGFYDLIAPRATFHTHAVDWYLSVLPRLGVPVHRDFTWLPERPAIAAALKAKWQPEGARWIALQ